MNLWEEINKLKDASGRMAIEKGQLATGAPSHGKPGDYGFGGRARNMPVTPRMAGGSIISAVAGNLANAGLEAAQPYIDSGMQSLASNLRGTGNIALR
jgi:hypothetical protein